MRSLSGLICRFRKNERGAIAILFGFVILVLVGGVGLAVDYGRSYNAASKLRSAADAAALAAAKLLDDPSASDDKIKAVATSYFQTQLINLGISDVSSTPLVVDIDRAASSVNVFSDISVGTTFAKVVAVPSINFNVETTVVYKIKKVELAMVLDVTGSMNSGGRLPGLKTAAKNIIDKLVNDTIGKHNRISLVPYSAAVNVGSYKDIASGGDSLDGCVMERLESTNRDNDEPSGFPNNFAVNGQLNSDSTGRYLCPTSTMTPLSKSASTLKSSIDSYTGDGWTAGHIGLAWGWNTLSPKWNSIFTSAAEPGPYDDDNIIKAVILMTDGEFNTAYSGGISVSEQKDESEARTLALCDAMKAQNIQIYTVAFEAPVPAQTLLQSCASSLGNYFNATDSTQLDAAFQTIADNLHTMRVTE